jgi:hypothetical protein
MFTVLVAFCDAGSSMVTRDVVKSSARQANIAS